MTQIAQRRLLRSEVPKEMTWDLTDLYPTREEWQQGLVKLQADVDEIIAFKGHSCQDGQTLLACLLALEQIMIQLTQLGTYARLKQAGDGTDPVNQEDMLTFSVVSTKVATATSFIDSEIIALDDSAFQALFEAESKLEVFRLFLCDIYAKKKHQLSPETEEALAAFGELSSAPYRIYSVSKAADMKFASFKDDEGQELPNSFALFEGKYEQTANTTIRRRAYDSFVKTLECYKNTYATVYATEVRKQIAERKLRNYESVTHMLLDPQKVTVEMYENQLNIIFNELAPHMRRFAKLKQRQLGLETMRFCDLKAPLDTDFSIPATMDNVRDTIIEAVAVLGEEYQNIIKRAFAERWIDYGDNVGKSTGAFCSSAYGVHPYVLITYQENMRTAFLLAHELGHAGNGYFVTKNQRIFNTRPSMYFVEAPSTMNEMLVAQYLMKQNNDPKMKRWVIIQLMGTYYHNFVTHLLEGEFQRRVYDLAEQGVSLTAKTLCETKLAVLREFWGDAVEIDEAASMTWMRQPHYYMGLYPYTYSAGLTASTAIAQQIAEEGQPAVDRWLKVLKAGGTLKPLELLKLAGLDMTTPEPIRKAVDYVGNLITQLETLY